MNEGSGDPYERILERAGCSRRVMAHCRRVREAAKAYTPKGIADESLVEAGAALHDLGRARTHGIAHGQLGGDLCRELGLPEAIARVVERHVGAGITPCECIRLGLLPRDCVPRTLEERIVAHADNMVQGDRILLLPESVLSAFPLDRRTRRRMYRLALEMNLLRE